MKGVWLCGWSDQTIWIFALILKAMVEKNQGNSHKSLDWIEATESNHICGDP